MDNIRVLQFGEGNFLRAFADQVIQEACEAGVFTGDVAVVKPRGDLPLTVFEKQNNTYTVCVRGQDENGPIEENHPVNVIRRALNPNLEPEAYRQLCLSEQLRFVISNTTEAGIVYDPQDDLFAPVPKTFPARVARLLYDRYNHFRGDPQKGLYFLPCELIDNNGDTLRSCVLRLAEHWHLPAEFTQWVQENCWFCNTLVDRIVSGFPKADPKPFFDAIGWEDQLLTVCEPFYLWVIRQQGDICREFPVHKACSGVRYVENVTPYKERKVRLLNGAHTGLVALSLLSGQEYVAQTVEDPALLGFLEDLYAREIIPAFQGLPEKELWEFADSVKARFRNPFLFHRWESISLNSFSKFTARLMPTARDYRARFGRIPQRIALALAALIRLYCTASVSDSPEILEFFEKNRGLEPAQLVQAMKAASCFQLEPEMLEGAAFWLEQLERFGVEKCLQAFTNTVHIHPDDTVAVAKRPVYRGEPVCVNGALLLAQGDIPAGHKIAVMAVGAGEPVNKYGYPIGKATQPIQSGEQVHTHNMRSGLTGTEEILYVSAASTIPELEAATFQGYLRKNGKVGTRNEIWVIPTVGCIEQTAQTLARQAHDRRPQGIDGVYAMTHPYGCSQLGGDHENTRALLAALASHPNAAGVLLLGLGCENNQLNELLPLVENDNLKTLICQEADDELAQGAALLDQLMAAAAENTRKTLPASLLTVGLKCGGSDGFSGVTANVVTGAFADLLCGMGGSVVMGEVPEMFGAEQALLGRCRSEEVFDQALAMVNSWKHYYLDRGLPVCENPSPGNQAGGITTLEEKSLGCVQKCGAGTIVDVLPYAKTHSKQGVTLLSTPGNDLVAATALAAAGCQLVIFTTGRGTPYGTCVPTLKVSTNTALAQKKANWIDFDTGTLLEQATISGLAKDLLEKVLATASGEAAKNEESGARQIAIWKDGVTL